MKILPKVTRAGKGQYRCGRFRARLSAGGRRCRIGFGNKLCLPPVGGRGLRFLLGRLHSADYAHVPPELRNRLEALLVVVLSDFEARAYQAN